MPVPTERPWFTGVDVYRDLTHHFSLLYPRGWHKFELDAEGGQGIILTPSPDPADVATSLSIEARDLGTVVTAADLPILRQGVVRGLRQLRDLRIESQEGEDTADFLNLEFRFTFRESADGPRRKRWLRLAYQDATQVRLIAQGADEAHFEYWMPFFYQAIRTFQFADWWAEFTGRSWEPTMIPLPAVDDAG